MSISRVIAAGTFVITAWLVASFFRETPILTENFTADIMPIQQGPSELAE